TAMMGAFMLIPNAPAYILFNLQYPRPKLSLIYLFGGVTTLAAVPLVGLLVDRLGAFLVAAAATLLLAGVTFVYFIAYTPAVPVVVLAVSFMTAMGFRNVAYSTLLTKVPRLPERARFMSIQSAVQHGASALGAFLAARLLVEDAATHALAGLAGVAWLS